MDVEKIPVMEDGPVNGAAENGTSMATDTGIVFPPPRDAAKVPVSKAKIQATPTFCAGDKVDVTEVNNYLQHYGYMPLSPSSSSAAASGAEAGPVGEDTAAALRAFQEF